GMAEEVVNLVGDGVEEVAAAADHAPRANMRWSSAMSSFALRRMCQLIATGVRTDKGFKEVHLNQVAKVVHEFSGIEVSGNQVYNHLRKWRKIWVRVSKLRELSGANWDGDLCIISLEDEHFKGHIKAHPKDAELLNRPIENYKQMMMIFGTGLATGKYAMGSNETLGTPSDFDGSFIKSEPYDEEKATKAIDEMAKVWAEPANDVKEVSSGPSRKRKRSTLTEEYTQVMCSMTEAVKDVAAAIRETKVEIMHLDLYGAVMYMPGFPEEALIVAFSHLVDNKAQGDAFVKMSDNHRVLWLRTWLGKHYY
ncbi:hypothetical protein U9M48_002279, partial [Paspalum notatum var. saurae]